MPKKKVVTREEFDRLFKMDSAIVSSLQSRLDIIETAVDEYILPPIIDVLTGLRRLEERLSIEIGRNEANEQICEDRSDALSDEREAIVKRLDKIEERLAESDEDQHEVFLYNKAKDEADETAFGLADDRLTALESQIAENDATCQAHCKALGQQIADLTQRFESALKRPAVVDDILQRIDKLEAVVTNVERVQFGSPLKTPIPVLRGTATMDIYTNEKRQVLVPLKDTPATRRITPEQAKELLEDVLFQNEKRIPMAVATAAAERINANFLGAEKK